MFHCIGSARTRLITPLRGIFHPLGAAFFSNATYTETLKILNTTNVTSEPFQLAGAREMFRYNYTDGAIEENPALIPQFLASLSAEIPRYVALWTQRFRPLSVAGYKVRHKLFADSGTATAS